jgi:DNA-binding transcriptional LysR family regulator
MHLVDRVSQRLKLRDLRLLDAVVRWKSMARAATQLNVTQPAVSKAIAEMEHTLGVRLLDRSRQGVEPTPYGRALLKRGAAIFDELRQGVREIEFLSDPAAGEVRISTSEPFAAGLLPIVLARLSHRYPRVSIYVTQSPIATLQHRQPRYSELRERNVDLVLGPIVVSNSDDDIEAAPLFDEHLVVAAGISNPWAHRRKIELADLIDEPWSLQPPDTIAGARSVEAFRACGLDVPRGKLISTSVQLQIGLVAAHQFLSMFPRSLVWFGAKRFAIKALPIRLLVKPRQIGIVTLKNRTISPAAKIFVQTAREVLAQVPAIVC